MTDKVKCCEKLFSDYHLYPCSRNATTEHEGRPYCKQHNPALRKAKYDARFQTWRDEEEAKNKVYFDNAHKIAVHDELVSALENLLSEGFVGNADIDDSAYIEICPTMGDFRKALAALSKAKS